MSEISIPLDNETITEMSLIDLAHRLMIEAKQPFYYFDLLNELARVKQVSEEEIRPFMGSLYTDLNVDGRFTCVGQNLWGLKEWYPVETTDQDLLAIEAFSPDDGDEYEAYIELDAEFEESEALVEEEEEESLEEDDEDVEFEELDEDEELDEGSDEEL